MSVPSPVLKYPGAKWRLADWIIRHMPAHEVYLEPYFGSGAVFFRKAAVPVETINDVHHSVVNLFRVLRERPEDLARLVELTPWARAEYELSLEPAEEPAEDPLEEARRFLVRCWQSYGASDRYKQGWRRRVNTGGDGSVTAQWRLVPGRITAAAERLRDAQIECRPAVEVIRGHRSPEVLIYADPPYVRSTRTGKDRRGWDHYRHRYVHEMTDEQHAGMLEALCAHPGPVLLSGYDCPLYRERLDGWRRVTKRTIAEGAHIREESLWLNPTAVEMQPLLLLHGGGEGT